jgi:hypothetical protein
MSPAPAAVQTASEKFMPHLTNARHFANAQGSGVGTP